MLLLPTSVPVVPR